jgi:hypothetical protein
VRGGDRRHHPLSGHTAHEHQVVAAIAARSKRPTSSHALVYPEADPHTVGARDRPDSDRVMSKEGLTP